MAKRDQVLIGKVFPFEDYQVFRPSRVESKVGNCVVGGNKAGIIQFCLKLLGVFGKNHSIASARRVWIHGVKVYVRGNMIGKRGQRPVPPGLKC